MGMHSVEAGYDTTHVPHASVDNPAAVVLADREQRARKALELAALSAHGSPVVDVDNPTPPVLAAKAEWEEMLMMLGLADTPPAARPTPAANPTGKARVITAVRRISSADDDWRNHGVCRDKDPELHFPIGTSGPALLQIEQAKANCRRCPVVDACLSWALGNADDGVWGGMSEEERRAYKRRNGAHLTRAAA